MNERIERIREYIKKEKIECLVVDSPFDILYLLHINRSYNYIEINFVLLLTSEKVFLISNPLTLAFIKQYVPQNAEVIEIETASYIENHFRYTKKLQDIIKKEKIKKVGITSAAYIDISDCCIRIENPIPYFASVKTDTEIEFIRKSASILKKVYKKAKKKIVNGCGEIELRNAIDVALHKEGSERRAFPTKVAFGKNTANIFPVSTMERLKDNDIILIDMGGVYKGYVAEMGRTLFYGESNAKQREIYDIVLTAYRKLKEFLKPGVIAAAADAAVRDYFKEMKHSQYFYHPLGETIGLVKGGISLAPNSQHVLKSGMVFAVEPALCLPNWGGVKIKETIIIKEDGIEELTGGTEQNE